MSVTATKTTTTAAKLSVVATGRPQPKSGLRRRTQRRLTAPSQQRPLPLKICTSLPRSLEALDLTSASPTQTLASLRFLVLSYLAELERRLAEFESPNFDSWVLQGELTIEEAKEWARTALEMLEGIRADVCSHLPEFHFSDLSTMAMSHLPDLPEVPDFRSHLPDMPHLPDMNEMRSHLPDMPHLDNVKSHLRDKFDDVRTRFNEMEPLSYIPTLSNHLQNLHSHLSSTTEPSGLPAPNVMLSDLLEALLNSDLVQDILNPVQEDIVESEEMLLERAGEVADAVRRSFDGLKLIKYSDLPHPWRNNPFVTHGYRFIPLERWPLLAMSVFALHNETLNIHTHLIPFLLWGASLIPMFNSAHGLESPEILFMSFALLCLLSSAIWHTMSGCADHDSMEMCARVDYVGIGWLISASVGTIVHYGFQCHPEVGRAFLCLCFATGLAGNICPFMKWFNMHEYRFYRIGFFLSLAFSALGPMIAMSILHGPGTMFGFITPVFPSLASYLIGLAFYAAHFPERILSETVRQKLDSIGCGSHAIWHCFIVLAVSQHKAAIMTMRDGLQCMVAV